MKTTEQLTVLLAERVMRWTVAPGRFLVGNRQWMPRWRFQPAENLMDAFQLLDGAAPDEYSMSGGADGGFRVRVRVGKATGEAHGGSKPLVITCALAHALGIELPDELGARVSTPAHRRGSRSGSKPDGI